MESISDYINSGIIEEYVLGLSSTEDKAEVEYLAQLHPEIQSAIDDFSLALEEYAKIDAVPVDPTIKPMVLATNDFIARIEQGEQLYDVPILTHTSTIEEYRQWLNRTDMVLPDEPVDIFVKLLAATPQVTTAIVWLKEGAPDEVHNDLYERFLVVEGSCTILVGDTPHSLSPGDYLSIPLHVNHRVSVTSAGYCKVILQRVAA